MTFSLILMLPALPLRRACTASFYRYFVEGAPSQAICASSFLYHSFVLEFCQRPLRGTKRQPTFRQLNKLRCRSNLTLLNNPQRQVTTFTHPILSTKSVMNVRNSHFDTYITAKGGGAVCVCQFGYFFCHTVGI